MRIIRVEQYVLKADLEPRLQELRCVAGSKRGPVDEDGETRRLQKLKVSVE